MRKLYSVLFSFLFITSAFAQAPTNGLVSEWLFNDGAITNGSNSLLAILSGSPAAVFAEDRFGNPNSAVNVNPGGFINFAGDEFDAYTTGASATFAYSFWLKLDAFDNNYKCIMAKASFETPCQIAGRQYAILVTPTGKLQLQAFGSLTGGHARVDGNTTITAGVWHHIVISVDMATLLSSLPSTTGLTMYVDGVLQTNTVSEISGNGILPSGMQNGVAHFGFGTYLNPSGSSCVSSQNIDAHFDDFRIYDRTVDASEVDALMADGCDVAEFASIDLDVDCSGPTLVTVMLDRVVPEVSMEFFDGTNWNLVTGVLLNSDGIINPVNQAGLYRVKAVLDCGANIYSEDITVPVGGPIIASQTEGTAGFPVFLCPANGSVELTVDAVGENVTYQWYSAANVPPFTYTPISGAINPTYNAPSGNMVYQVEVTACGQMVTSDDIYVVLAGQPTINIINVSNGGTICLGGSATMTISTSNVGQASWEPNNGTPQGAQAYSVSPSETTTYTVTGTNSQSGCFATASTTITVNEPQAVIMENNGVLTATGGPFDTYQWYLNGTPIQQSNVESLGFSTAAGDYYVVVTEGGCSGTSAVFTYNGIPTGIADATTNGLAIYPNPFNSEFIIETNELTSISVMNALGEVVLSRTVNGRTSIDASSLSAGVYFVQEETSGAVMKLVKN